MNITDIDRIFAPVQLAFSLGQRDAVDLPFIPLSASSSPPLSFHVPWARALTSLLLWMELTWG